MIKLSLKNSPDKLFNLKDFSTEKKLEAAWKAMTNEPKFEHKRFNITTDLGDQLSLKIGDITNCKFDDSTYIKAEVHTKRDEPKPPPPPKDPYGAFMDKIEEKNKERERRNIEKFLSILRQRGHRVNMNDPALIDILEYVKKARDGENFKIQMYANLYTNTKKGV